MIQEVFAREEAAHWLRVSIRSFDNLVKSGAIRGVQVTPGRLVFRVEELRRYVAEKEGRHSAPRNAGEDESRNDNK